MKTITTITHAVSVAALAIALVSSHAHAQAAAPAKADAATNPAPDIPEIVVTAQLRRESAQSVPISITAVSGDSLAKANVTSLQDLAGAVPGVVVSKSISYGLAPISIRGLGGPAGGGSLFTDQPVAVYVDGVYVPALAQSVSDFLDVDSLQILRGPQGTLYGRNSTAGAILINSKRPDLDAIGGNAKVGYSSYNDFSTSAVLNLPLIHDQLGLRVAASHEGGGNWASNSVDSRKFGGGESTNLRGSLRWRGATGATIDLIIDHSESTSSPATISLATTTPVYAGPALGTVYVGNPYQRRSDFETVLNDRTVQIAGPQFTHTLATDVTVQAEVPLSFAKLTSITGYRDFEVRGAQDVSAAPQPAVTLNSNTTDQKQKSFSQELRLGSDGPGPLKWTTGLYYFHQDTNAFIDIIALQGGPPVATGFGARGPIFAGKPSGTSALFQAGQKVDSFAAFADATYNLTSQFSLTGGLRYSNDHKVATIAQQVTTITNTVLAGPVLQSGSCPSAAVPCTATFSNVSPRAVATWQATPRNMVYASYSKGFNAGGFNNFGDVANPADPTNPLANSSETITNYEIGTKNEFFGRKLKINLSAFQTDYNNLHIRQAVLTGGVAIINVPRARVRGLELESVITPARGLTFSLNGSYLDGKLLEGTLAALPTNTGSIVVGQNATVQNQDIAGNTMTRSPKWQGSASVAYVVPTGFGAITPSATWRGQTKLLFLETNQDSAQYTAAGWSEVDVRLAITPASDRWDIALFGKNILNKRYISQIVPFSGLPIATLNTPVTWGATARIKF